MALAQGIPFCHGGEELLRSRSLDRNSHDSGDWFDAIDWTGRVSSFGVSLPPAPEDGSSWSVMRPLPADRTLRPGPPELALARAHHRRVRLPRDGRPTAADRAAQGRSRDRPCAPPRTGAGDSGLECAGVSLVPEQTRLTSSRPRALAAGLLAAALFAAYLWVPNERGANDNYAHCLTALSLARGEWGRLDGLRAYWASDVLDLRATVIETPDGHVVGGTGIGAALALAPFYAVALRAGAAPILVLSPAFNHPIAALWSAMAVAAFFLAASRLVERGPALLATSTLALGSSLLSVLSREPWQHTFLVALQCVGLWLVLGSGAVPARGRVFAAGLVLGWGGLVRATGFLYVLPWAWLVRRAGQDRIRPFLAGVLPGVLATLAYNWWTFGRPWMLGQIIIGRVRFGYEASQAVPYDPLAALAGLLASPGRGLFVFSPVLLWALLVLAAAAVERPRARVAGGRSGLAPWPFWLAPAAATVAVNLASAATWKEWAGGWTYGPRYLSDTIPLWGLIVAAAAQAGRSHAAVPHGLTALAWPLLALSFAFHAAGLLVSPYRPDAYSARVDPDHHPERLWRWRDFPPLDNLRLWLRDRARSGRTRAP